MDALAVSHYVLLVLTLNPAFVFSEPLNTDGLLDQARAGDAEAFGGICRVYETRLLRQALTLCGNPTLAEDLVQETLVEAWKSLHRYNGRCQFFTWLCAILLNRYRNTHRRKWLLPFSTLAATDTERLSAKIDALPAPESHPDQSAQMREEAAAILACINALPSKHQQVIYLRFYVDQSLEGIAEALGCSVGTVKSQLFRALDKLRSMRGIQAQFKNLERSSKDV